MARIVRIGLQDYEASLSLQQLSGYLSRYYGKKVIILLDEYDTPMQEVYSGGYWEKLAAFTRSLFNATFKNNPYLERAIMTGLTRVSRESVFSDLNNLEVVTTTSEKYADAFGFTEEEVDAALEEFGLVEKKPEVKRWYDGFNEKDLAETAREALCQIEEKNYAASMYARGMCRENIRTYGVAFQGKQVLIMNGR